VTPLPGWWEGPPDGTALECAVCGERFEPGDTVLCDDLARVCWTCFLEHNLTADDQEFL
jgi:hypothetical protein